jgi:hypothetical protein
LTSFVVGGVILGVLAIIVGIVVTAPPNASLNERIAYAVVGFLAAVAVAALAAFGVAVVRAPYEQRDSLRVAVNGLKTNLVAITAMRDALLDHGFSDSVIHHRSFRLADLPMDKRGVVSGKRFEYCVIQGPGIIVALSGTNLAGLQFEGPVDSVVWLLPPDPVIAAVGLEYCEFVECRMDHVGIGANAEQIPYLKRMLAGEIKGYKVGKNQNDITVIY